MSRLLTVTEAADHFKVSTATIRRWIRSGRVSSQLTLGPFGEQWMIDSESLRERERSSESALAAGPRASHAAGDNPMFIAVDQLVAQGDSQSLLLEAENALKEAWRAREAAETLLAETRSRAEADLSELRTRADAEKSELQAQFDLRLAELTAQVRQVPPDVVALRCDLEGSERKRAELQRDLRRAQAVQNEAWQESRHALQALGDLYSRLEGLQLELGHLRSESECLRRTLAARLGVEWTEHDLLSLFMRWDVESLQPNVDRSQPKAGRGVKSWADARGPHAATPSEMAVGE